MEICFQIVSCEDATFFVVVGSVMYLICSLWLLNRITLYLSVLYSHTSTVNHHLSSYGTRYHKFTVPSYNMFGHSIYHVCTYAYILCFIAYASYSYIISFTFICISNTLHQYHLAPPALLYHSNCIGNPIVTSNS